jgi:hypothetical protein
VHPPSAAAFPPTGEARFTRRTLLRSAIQRRHSSESDVYIGDGASVTRPVIRRREGVRIGHSPIRTQLDWCRAQAVARAIFTHCGSQIVGGDERVLGPLVRRLGRKRGLDARIAYDGMELSLDELNLLCPSR